MKCPKCKIDVSPNLEEVGTQTKATCPECGAYIKWVGRDELDAIVTATNLAWAKDGIVDEPTKEATLIIKTMAPEEYHPEILNRVKKSLERGFTNGEGSISKPFDDEPYHYDYEYK